MLTCFKIIWGRRATSIIKSLGEKALGRYIYWHTFFKLNILRTSMYRKFKKFLLLYTSIDESIENICLIQKEMIDTIS